MENRFMKPLEGFENNTKEIENPTTGVTESAVQNDANRFMKTLGSPDTTGETHKDYQNTEEQSFAGGSQEHKQAQANQCPSQEDSIGYAIDIRHLNHTFDVGTEHEFKIFDDFNLQVENNLKNSQENSQENSLKKSEVVTLMGGSGCGKSCILRVAAGLMVPDSGDIRILGRPISEYKSVPMVFQSYSSFEWKTVVDNVALPMLIKGIDKREAKERAYEILKQVGLSEQATKYAKASVLSGGQLQRVAIARCLASDSPVFFLDEATGALDIKMKREIQDLIIKIASETEHTIVNVTHSLEEALYISDKIFILKPNPCTIYKTMDITYGDIQRNRQIFETDIYRNYSRELGSILDEVCK